MGFLYPLHLKLNHAGNGEIFFINNKIFLEYSDQFIRKILKNLVDKNDHDTTISRFVPVS